MGEHVLRQGDSGGAHQRIRRAQLLHGPLDKGGGLSGVGGVGPDGQHADASGAQLVLERMCSLLGVQIAEGDVPALEGKRAGDGRPDAPAAAGDEYGAHMDDLLVELKCMICA